MTRRSIAVTLTFRDGVAVRTGYYQLARILYRKKKKFTFSFMPDRALDNECRFHFHGTITYELSNECYVKSFLANWSRYNGFIKMKPIQNKIGWHVYCIKTMHEFCQMLKMPPQALILGNHNAYKVYKYFNQYYRTTTQTGYLKQSIIDLLNKLPD